ncbi:MAG TPA: hypothetical protein VGX50_13390, partial [Longimicrobium sp.]|nr:hypothetical protein [Longimicrobium sp.]
MLSRIRVVLPCLCAAALLGACADEIDPTSPSAAAPRLASASAPAATSADELARIFAAGLSRPEVRAAVRNAMRQSPFNEHKLVLQDWAATPEGARTVRSIAEAAGVEASAVAGLIQSLPSMDFYLPFREHRLRWTGTADVAVAATMDPDRVEITGFEVGAARRVYRRTDGVPQRVLVMLHPAEPKGYRMRPQANRSGATVQDPDDGELSMGTMDISEDDPCSGTFVNEGCGGGSGGGSGGTYTPPSGTYMEGFWFTEEADTEWGDEELEFRGQLRSGACGGCTEVSKTLRYEGVNTGGSFAKYWDKFNQFFTHRVADTSKWIVVALYETDAFADDSFGERTWTYQDFAAGYVAGQATRNWSTVFTCPNQPYSMCESVRVSADLRV